MKTETPVSTPIGREISVGNEPGELAFTKNSIWITSVQWLIRIDRQTLRVVSRIDIGRFDPAFIGGGSDIATSAGGVWVTCACGVSYDPRFTKEPTGGLVLIDPETRRGLRTRVYTDRTPTSIAVDDSSVWLSTEGSVRRLNRSSLRTVSTIQLNRYVGELSVCCGSVWAAVNDEREGFIARIDSQSGKVVARAAMPGPVNDVVATEDAVWVVSGKAALRIDPRTNKISASVPLTHPGYALTVGAGSIWVVAFHEGTLTRIDADSLQVASAQDVGAYPAHVAFADGSVWVVNLLPGTLRKISP